MKISAEALEVRRKESLRAIVNANIAKNTPDRDKVVTDTVTFVDQFKGLSTTQVKDLSQLRQRNGNVDPDLVDFVSFRSADALAAALDRHYSAGDRVVLMKGETAELGTLERDMVAEIS